MAKKYMAYNHNYTELMKEPATKERAQQEADEYSWVTGNRSYVEEVTDEENDS